MSWISRRRRYGEDTGGPPAPTCPILNVNYSFENPIAPDVSVPVGGWAEYQNDPNNVSATPFETFARTTDWASDGTFSLRLTSPSGDGSIQFDASPVCPATWAGPGAPKPSGWWPVTPGVPYVFKVDLKGIHDADYANDAQGVFIGIDFYNSSFASVGGTSNVGTNGLDTNVITGLSVSEIAPGSAAYAVPYIAFYKGSDYVDTYVDNATWKTTVLIPAPTLVSEFYTFNNQYVYLPIGAVPNLVGPALTANGATPFTWSATDLPPGLSLDSSTGILSGSTTGVFFGTSVFTVVDANGCTASFDVIFTVSNAATDPLIAFSFGFLHDDTPMSGFTIGANGEGLGTIDTFDSGTFNSDYPISISPDGTKYAVGAVVPDISNGQRYTVPNIATSASANLLTNVFAYGTLPNAGSLANFYSWSPDGTKVVCIYFDNTSHVGFSFTNVDNSGHSEIPFGTIGITSPSVLPNGAVLYSPDGTKLAYTTGGNVGPSPFNFNIRVCNSADGSSQTTVVSGTSGTSMGYRLCDWFSDNNSLLVVFRDSSGHDNIQKISLSGSLITSICTITGGIGFGALKPAALSPDQTKVVFIDNSGKFYTVPSDGSAAPTLLFDSYAHLGSGPVDPRTALSGGGAVIGEVDW